MKKQTVLIFGGSQQDTYVKVGEKMNCNVIFHGGKSRNGGVKKTFKSLVEKADCVVVMGGAIGHVSMDVVKKLCKEMNKPVVYQKGFGASLGIQRGLNAISNVA
ncbi:DUF2325 domain-containing protein [Sutcliffiella cohnii]|uniref:DUF2325 domain-containing protein n=1 Tax=Sutcliffiella cohnii TaxID=33932 RepID=UPI00082B8F90|nr:DUF2325 domain-containing protein [Sutcliffiella cohnii]